MQERERERKESGELASDACKITGSVRPQCRWKYEYADDAGAAAAWPNQ